MKPPIKVAIVAGCYLLAFVLAFAAVALHTALVNESGLPSSDGMSAFGDLVLFVAVFGTGSLLTTARLCTFCYRKKDA
jgi:hypothetical protein